MNRYKVSKNVGMRICDGCYTNCNIELNEIRRCCLLAILRDYITSGFLGDPLKCTTATSSGDITK